MVFWTFDITSLAEIISDAYFAFRLLYKSEFCALLEAPEEASSLIFIISFTP